MVVTITQQSQIWDSVLKLVYERMNDRHLFDSFIVNTKIHRIEGNKLFITTDSALAKDFLNTNSKYNEMIVECLKEVTESEFELIALTQEEVAQNQKKAVEKKPTFFANCRLNSKYTFDNFVVGNCNKEAVQASLMITTNPGVAFNPLFIYSKSGLGKTHLLHAIGNYFKEKNPYSKVLYITTDAFIDEFVKYVQGNQENESLKDYFKNVDVLLIDDIQFLSDKTKTSEMFFYIFNTLVNNNKQIVLTSDRHPNELKGLEDRLVSRFNMGLSINIHNPDTETLIEILKRKITSNGLDVKNFDADGLVFLAENFQKNVRELEGALNKLLFYLINVKHTGRIDLATVRESVLSIMTSKSKSKTVTEDKIIDAVADYYNLTENQIKSKTRTSQIALARHIAMYLCRTMLNTPYIKIGQFFGGRDHSTVITAVEKVDNSLKCDTLLATAISDIQKSLKR